MFGFSPWELGIILVIVLILFGGTRLPQLGRGLGQSLRDFKSALKKKVLGKKTSDGLGWDM